MKKILLLMFTIIGLTSFAQSKKDTTMSKNGCIYQFKSINQKTIELKNETTFQKYLDLEKLRQTSDDEIIEENKRIREHITNKATNLQEFLLSAFKTTFNDSKLQNYNHTMLINFVITVKSSGEILDIAIWMNKEILDIVSYDKLIEFESRIRNGYKVKPFINQNIKYKSRIMVRLDRNQLNAVFK